MKQKLFLSLLLFSHAFVFTAIYSKNAQWLLYKNGDFLFDFTAVNKTEAFYVKNAEYFSGSPMDQSIYVQGTWDFNTHTRFGDVIKSKLTLRNKAKWGNTRSLLTTQEQLQILDFTLDDHSHSFNRLIPWFRKAWVKFSINDAFDIKADRKHSLKFGAFPYQLGRGISLGAAYAVSPGVLGFFTDNTIDQFAFGALWRGHLTANHNVTYDFYCAMLENLSASFSQTTEVVNRNCLNCASIYRGYGDLNIVYASRIRAHLLNSETFGRLVFEPYILYDWVPAQKITVRSDANVKLWTMGAAVEYAGRRWELGFETAFNFGRQHAKGWDRNYIIPHRNGTTGALEEVYGAVYVGEKDATGSNVAPVTDANKTIVDNAPKGAVFNGLEIGSSGLFNGPYRFRPAYDNKFAGCMAVIDGTFWFQPQTLRGSLAIGYASGDEHPNIVLEDPSDTERTSTYGGFIGLQEIYSGKRVRSIFVIGGQSITRPLSSPELKVSQDRHFYATNVQGFSNLIYTGAGFTWTPDNYKRKIMLNSNALYYWQDKPTNKYCLSRYGNETSSASNETASKALGLEINLFLDVHWLSNLKGFLATAVFVPGKHFDEIIGKPTNAKQFAEVSRSSRYEIDYNQYPLVNNKTAYVLNFGFEYNF